MNFDRNVYTIEDIQIGGLYHIPHYTTAMYIFTDPTERAEKLSCDILQGDAPFVPLELHTVNLNTFLDYEVTVLYRIKILTSEGKIGWISLQDKDLPYIFRIVSYDKK